MLKNLKDIRNQAAKVEQELTGSKFCTTCQKSKPISGGKMKVLNIQDGFVLIVLNLQKDK